MRFFRLSIFNIQQIKKLHFSIDLGKSSLKCIVGKNSTGKTTLIRAIRNLKFADTFQKTASPRIFSKDSRINYYIDTTEYDFTFQENINALDTKSIIDDNYKHNIYIELPIPYGERFNHFQSLVNIDSELRSKISLEDYVNPTELIEFLSKVYNSDRFNNLKEITIKQNKYYLILQDNDFYIREDYLSSGEYFVICLYKIIQSKSKIIAIDELDISLDASAQVNLIRELRIFCQKYKVNIIFTTHSLALIQTLEPDELFHLEKVDDESILVNRSFNYIKSILFGFNGWDKYILTEDSLLKAYLTNLLSPETIFSKYKIIYIGGGSNVVSLMNRNSTEEFFSKEGDVICVLDGDQKDEDYCKYCRNIFFIPFANIEAQLLDDFNSGKIKLNTSSKITEPKKLFSHVLSTNQLTESQIFNHLNAQKPQEIAQLKDVLINFLN